MRVKEGPRRAWLCDRQRILCTQCKSVGHQWRLEVVPTCASGHDGSGVFYITGQMDAGGVVGREGCEVDASHHCGERSIQRRDAVNGTS